MPTILRIGWYVIYFCPNENNPREPVHVHVAVRESIDAITEAWFSYFGEIRYFC